MAGADMDGIKGDFGPNEQKRIHLFKVDSRTEVCITVRVIVLRVLLVFRGGTRFGF